MSRTFRIGGFYPPKNKLSSSVATTAFPLPSEGVVLLTQHAGKPALPCVQKGDMVKVGQLIGEADGFMSANVHSPFSGRVKAVGEVTDGHGMRRMAVTITVEGDEWMHGIDRGSEIKKDFSLSPEQIVEKIRMSGIVGLGGAAFPTHVKLTPPEGKKAQYLVINGAECEPYLTADHRLMLEKAEQIVIGVRILARALGVEKSFIGIEDDKRDAISLLGNITMYDPAIRVVSLKAVFPQGSEKQIIEATTGRIVQPCTLPVDSGVVVQNVGTAFAVYEAVQKNKPLFERYITVSGNRIDKPANYLARIGTPVGSLVSACGSADVGKIVCGGPMTGKAISNPDAPITKGTSGVIVMSRKEAARARESVCIKCAKCVNVCCMGLQPFLLGKLVKHGRYEEAAAQRLLECLECGSCSYLCPASLPLLDMIRVGKAEVRKYKQ